MQQSFGTFFFLYAGIGGVFRGGDDGDWGIDTSPGPFRFGATARVSGNGLDSVAVQARSLTEVMIRPQGPLLRIRLAYLSRGRQPSAMAIAAVSAAAWRTVM